MTAWEPDVLPGYWQQTLALGPDPDGEGDLVATLIRAGEREQPTRHAVLLVHGFTDYFFHTEVADAFIAAASPSTHSTCTSAGGPGGKAKLHTSPPT